MFKLFMFFYNIKLWILRKKKICLNCDYIEKDLSGYQCKVRHDCINNLNLPVQLCDKACKRFFKS